MNMDDIELKLLAGMPIEIEGVGKLRSPLLRDVIKIGESLYNQYLSVLLFDKDNLEDETNENVSNFELLFAFAYHQEHLRNTLLDSIEFFFNKKAHLDFNGQDVFFSFDDGNKICRSSFDHIQDVIRIANWIKKVDKEPKFKAGNEQARKFMEKLKQLKKDAPKKKETISLHSMINGMAWKSKDINLFNIFDLSIYQMKLGFMTLENIDNYSHTLQGIFTGNIDSKNIKFDQIHWAKILNI
jgi:hypothetical protein